MTDFNRSPEAQDTFKQKGKPKTPIKFKISLNEEQKEAKELILNTPITLIKGMAGSGKANWVETPVLTPEGPIRMGDIKAGDFVISEKGKPIKVLQIFPQGKQEIYTITFSDGSTTQCTKDHLWNVISRNDLHSKKNRNGKDNKKYQTYQTYPLEEIIDKGIKQFNRNKWFIPQSPPVEFEDKIITLDPYIMGCLLGDGCLIGTPSITSVDDYIIEYFKYYFNEKDINVTPSCEGSISYYLSYGKCKKIKYDDMIFNSVVELISHLKISHGTYYKRLNNGNIIIEEIKNPLIDILKEYKLYGKSSFEKHIPKEYLFSSIETRINLLQGLLDTDGWVNSSKNSSSTHYCTVSTQLKDDLVYLVNSLGGVCSVTEKLGKYKAKGEKHYKTTSKNYRLTISFNDHNIERRLFRLERKQNLVKLSQNIINRSISKIELSFIDDAQCILVDSNTHLYLTDNYIVTHNTLLACQIALDLVFRKDMDKLIITRPTVSKEDIGFLPGGIHEKMDPWLAPIYSNLYLLYDKEKIEKMVTEGLIEIVPFAFMRGRTFPNSFIIVDECQNMTVAQTEMMMGRLGKGGKMVFCGDGAQIDLKSKKDSGISFFPILEARTPNVKIKSLKKNHRHEALEEILNIFEEYRD